MSADDKNEQNTEKMPNEKEIKAETIVFKSESVNEEKNEQLKNSNSVPNAKAVNTDVPKSEQTKKVEAKVAEILEESASKKRKTGTVLAIVIVILIFLLFFSTIFAIIHSMNGKIAKGIKVKGIDVSGLTINEAEDKLDEAFKTILDVNIELDCNDYKYVIKPEDVGLKYDFNNELKEAYSVGRNGNILKSNYNLMRIAFFGRDYNIDYEFNQDSIDSIVSEISASVPGLVTQYSFYIEDDNLIINPGTDGIQVNKAKLKELIINDFKTRNPLEIAKNFNTSKIKIPYANVKADAIDMDKVYNEVHTEPENAYFIAATDTEKAKIFADVDGIDFAISMDEAKAKLDVEADEYIIPLTKQKAEITINDIGLEAFPNELQEFSTRYDASLWGRSENIRIATNKIDGTVLMPGQQFSFNGVVGERTVQAGYKNAAIFEGDKVVDGLAGGICQVSSTLYNAALLANLQIDERYNHSFKTSYLEFGRDATVVYGAKDLKFTNTRSYPIKIEGNAGNGVLSFSIYGIEEDTEYKINIIPVVTSTIPYTTQTITDYDLDPGMQAVKQGGSSGARVTTYKETILDGNILSKEVISNDVYKAMTRIVLVGPDEAPVSNPEPVPEPVLVDEPESEPVPEPTPDPEPVTETEPEIETTSETPEE